MKKYAVRALIVGIILLIVGFLLPVPSLSAVQQTLPPSIAIIGGADDPAAQFLTARVFYTLLFSPERMCFIPFFMRLFGGAIVVSSLLCLIFRKMVMADCTLKTSALSLGISAAATGMYGFVRAAVYSSFKTNPVQVVVYIIISVLCAAVCVWLVCLYIKCRKAHPSVKGMVLDAVLALVYCYPFYGVCSVAGYLITGW